MCFIFLVYIAIAEQRYAHALMDYPLYINQTVCQRRRVKKGKNSSKSDWVAARRCPFISKRKEKRVLFATKEESSCPAAHASLGRCDSLSLALSHIPWNKRKREYLA